MEILKVIKRKAFLDFIIWLVFILLTSTMIAYSFQGTKLFSSFFYYIKFASYGWGLGFAFWGGHRLIGYYTEKKLDWTKNLKKANVISLSIYITYGIIISGTLSYLFGRFVLENTGESLFWDAFIKTLIIMFIDFIFISIYYSTNLTKFWKIAIENNEELKRENLMAKYEALKNQVNPHFLFNSLNTLSGVVEQNPAQATDFIKKLSNIYRYVLEQSDKELVSLKQEMKFVEDYIFLSKMRFGESLVFISAIPTYINVFVAPLGLQMLIENAIKHNIISDKKPLKIEIELEDGFVVVKNNLQKKKTIRPDKAPLGMENLKKRYAYLSDISVEVTESDNVFMVKLPILNVKI